MTPDTERLIDAYVAALPIRPIAIIRGPDDTTSRLGIACTADAIDALWFRKVAHAELVAMTCLDDLQALAAIGPDGWINLASETTRGFVVAAADRLGADWRTDAQVRADARFEVDKVLMAIDVRKRTGGLHEVNRAYRVKRLAARAAGDKISSYNNYIAEFVASLVRLAAQNVPG